MWVKNRVKVVVALQRQWGKVHDMYGAQRGSMFEENPVPKGIRDPDSAFSGYWDITQIFLLLYVSAAVPTRIGFDETVTTYGALYFWDLHVDLFFILDVFLSFRTAYWNENGTLEVQASVIRSAYLRGWFMFDFISSAPASWVTLVYDIADPDADHIGSHMSAVKAIRLLKLFRLLRLARLKSLLLRADQLFGVDLRPFMGLIMTFFSIFLAAHMMSCGWFLIGSSRCKL
jgi:hypothetical protein